MLREVPFGQDGDFSEKALINRINGDLGNSLGNLLNRVIGMSGKYFNSKFEAEIKLFSKDLNEVNHLIENLENYIFQMQIHKYLEDIWKILSIGNLAIQNNEPWAKIKTDPDEVKELLVFVSNLLSKVAILISPIMPESAEKMAKALGIEISSKSYQEFIREAKIKTSFELTKISALFPRVEKPLIEQPKTELPTKNKTSKPETKIKSEDGLITIDKFFETKIKIGQIIEVEELPKSKKLYKLKVDLGEENSRQIIAGIREYYQKDELLNSLVCVVANLKPAKLMGQISEGMLLAAKDENGLSLIRPEHSRKVGTKIS